ncbi:MAG: glycosidase, partial [Caldilineaceae bacterium]
MSTATLAPLTIAGASLPGLPWEDRAAHSRDLLWRYSGNPVITPAEHANANSIFNSAVVPFGQGWAGVFRIDDRRHEMNIHAGFSDDAIHWRLDENPIAFACDESEIANLVYRYDPRVVWLEDRYCVTWCNGYHGPTIGVGYTHDFRTFHQIENAFLPYNRNGVLFPRRIRGKFAMLSRPSDTGHTPFGDIFYSESPDMEHWGHHRWVMGP